MCTTCGCELGPGVNHDHDHDHDHDQEVAHSHERPRTMRFERDLLAKNDELAGETRRSLAKLGVRLFNVIGAPGAGKTALLEATIARLRHEIPLAVLEGDQATDRDAKRIARAGCRVFQINTDAGCHLDASMVADGLRTLAPTPGTVVFVENVGNLVCPALFDVGEHAKIVVMSVTEGEDKPLKYPHVFRAADLLVLTKIDLLPHLELDEAELMAFAREVNPGLLVTRLSSRTGHGVDHFCSWIRGEAARAS